MTDFDEERGDGGMTMQKRILIALALVLMVVASACGKAAELATEKALEQASGDQVDIKGDGTVEVKTTDAEGNEQSLTLGETELPSDFPMPIPPDGKVVSVSTLDSAAGTAYVVSVDFPPDQFDAVVQLYEDFMNKEGFEVSKSVSNEGGTRSAFIIGDRTDVGAVVSVEEFGDYDEATLSWSPQG